MPTISIVGEKILTSSINYDPQPIVSGFDTNIITSPTRSAFSFRHYLPVFVIQALQQFAGGAGERGGRPLPSGGGAPRHPRARV